MCLFSPIKNIENYLTEIKILLKSWNKINMKSALI